MNNLDITKQVVCQNCGNRHIQGILCKCRLNDMFEVKEQAAIPMIQADMKPLVEGVLANQIGLNIATVNMILNKYELPADVYTSLKMMKDVSEITLRTYKALKS